ncbi:MAG: 2Fe-2S iron-sulfur cluster-binding protein [Thermovirgaceae bacterium]
MKEITLTIDGKQCKGEHGDTILTVARKNDVYIPTLCYLEGLTPIGSCRMCVVEVEKNPKLLTACTTPAQDGMVVHTQTETLFNYRKQVLELLFAGRNHFCMYCSQSGDCELQRLAIEHGMDHVRYPYLYSDFENDATHPDLQLDHNRCILCLRCIRVCAEKVGAHTLDLKDRGWNAKIMSDLGNKLGESDTCVDCGACAQVCPTGTITIREFAYRGRRSDCDEVVESVCPLCAVGCRFKGYVRTGSIARVEGLGTEEPDGGQLCYKGRLELPRSTERNRIHVPMIREGVHYREASWEEALGLVAEKFSKAREKESAGALVSSLCTDEELAVFSRFFRDSMGKKRMDTFDGDILRGFRDGFEPFRKQGVRPFTAAHNILDSDCIINLCAKPDEEAPVVASYIRVGTLKNEASLINVCNEGNPFEGITDIDLRLKQPCGDAGLLWELGRTITSLKLAEDDIGKGTEALNDYRDALTKAGDAAGIGIEDLEKLIHCLVTSEKPVFVLGSAVSTNPEVVTAAVNLAIAAGAFFDDGIGVVPLVSSGNSLGTINTVLAEKAWLGKEDLDFLYVFSTGLIPEDEESLAAISRTRFVVVQSPYMAHPLVNIADVLLPAPAWYERSGHFCTIEGERRRLNVIVSPQGDVRSLSSVLGDVARNLDVSLGKPEAAPCEQIYESQIAPNKAKMVELEEVSR